MSGLMSHFPAIETPVAPARTVNTVVQSEGTQTIVVVEVSIFHKKFDPSGNGSRKD